MSLGVIESLFALSAQIRYVAVYRGGVLISQQRGGIVGASSAETDRYEELLVNPALLLLARQRGNIDCGGAHFVLVGYGQFLQLVVDLPDGHVSLAFELGSDPLLYAEQVRQICLEIGCRGRDAFAMASVHAVPINSK